MSAEVSVPADRPGPEGSGGNDRQLLYGPVEVTLIPWQTRCRDDAARAVVSAAGQLVRGLPNPRSSTPTTR